MPGTQVVRIESYNKGGMSGVTHEANRTAGIRYRNAENIDPALTKFNIVYKSLGEKTPFGAFNQMRDALGVESEIRKNTQIVQEVLITSGRDFFESLDFQFGTEPNELVRQFFEEAYAWVLREFGFNGTDENILTACVHLDEPGGDPHLQVVFVPLVTEWKEKVYERDETGEIKRNSHGSPIQARDEKGKLVYLQREDLDHPRINKDAFWKQRGGRTSYTKMQDRFQEEIGAAWELGRGQVGSTATHKSQYQWHEEQRVAELKKEAGRAQRATRKARDERGKLKSELSDLNDGIEVARETREKAERDAKRARRETKAAIDEKREAQAAEKAARLRVSAAEKAAADAEVAISSKQGQLSDTEEKLRTAENRLQVLYAEVTDMEAHRDEAKRSWQEFQENGEKARSELESLSAKVQTARNDERKAKSAVTTLNAQKDDLLAEISMATEGMDYIAPILERGRVNPITKSVTYDARDVSTIRRYATMGSVTDTMRRQMSADRRAKEEAERQSKADRQKAAKAEKAKAKALASVEPLQNENGRLKDQVADLRSQVANIPARIKAAVAEATRPLERMLESAKIAVHDLGGRLLDFCLLAASIGERYILNDDDLQAGCANAVEYAREGLEAAGEEDFARISQSQKPGLTNAFRGWLERLREKKIEREKKRSQSRSWDMEH